MKRLKRFGVSMEETLLAKFDRLITQRGYTNRSEAFRDLVREQLVEEDLQSVSGEVFGALVFVYDHHRRELDRKLADLQHDHYQTIISTAHVHVSHDQCLEVILMRGAAVTIQEIANRILSTKGVQHGKLTLTSSLHLTEHTHTS